MLDIISKFTCGLLVAWLLMFITLMVTRFTGPASVADLCAYVLPFALVVYVALSIVLFPFIRHRLKTTDNK
jgi:Na+/alanine symporter